MLKVYTSYNCSSCKKTLTWLEDHGIEYEEYNFFSKSITADEIMYILKFTENGFEDIISERSKVYEQFKEELENLSVSQYIDFIIDNPAILKRPIIVDDVTNNLVVGYNKYDMESFL